MKGMVIRKDPLPLHKTKTVGVWFEKEHDKNFMGIAPVKWFRSFPEAIKDVERFR
jgi:hypothetical protein